MPPSGTTERPENAAGGLFGSTQYLAEKPFLARACDECKRQKMKCSSFADYPQPCERCRQRGQPCRFTDTYKRITKHRARKEKQQGQKTQVKEPQQGEENHIGGTRTQPLQFYQPLEQSIFPALKNNNTPQGSSSSGFDSQGLPPSVARVSRDGDCVTSKVLQGVEISQIEIDETFLLFFKHYSSQLYSFANPRLSPDQYFRESALLFWTIVTIGSRQYPQNPTLQGALAGPVFDLVWTSMMQTGDNICSIIESMILLATWTTPVRTIFKDMTFTLSGMAISLAMQIGLHLPIQSQDFALTTVGSSTEECSQRANLWVNCVLCHCRTAAAFGQPPMTSLKSTFEMLIAEDLLRHIPRETILELRLMDLATQANAAVFEIDINKEGGDHHVMAVLSRFEENFAGLEPELNQFQDNELLHFHIARLQIRVHYLTHNDDVNQLGNWIKLYQDSFKVVTLCKKLEQSSQLCSFCPTYIWLMLALAACALLKILKSGRATLKGSSIHSEGRMAYFMAIALLRQVSIEPDDSPCRIAGALTQLWTGRKTPDFVALLGIIHGPEMGRRRPRSRLAMGLFYETLKSYREEYGGQTFRSSLAPRDTGVAHGALIRDPSASQTDSLFDDDSFQFQYDDVNLDHEIFANWVPMTDDDLGAFDFASGDIATKSNTNEAP